MPKGVPQKGLNPSSSQDLSYANHPSVFGVRGAMRLFSAVRKKNPVVMVVFKDF